MTNIVKVQEPRQSAVKVTAAELRGKDGLSTYDLAVQNGYEGPVTDWLASLNGTDGANGRDGTDGIQGEKGDTGAKGDKGDTGPQGANGADGKDGANGTNGTDGADGSNGDDGASAYQVAVANGFSGTEAQWLESLKGSGSGSGFLPAPDRHEKDSLYFYYGWENVNGGWLIERWARGAVKSQRSSSGHVDLTAAWANKTTLNYGE